MHIEVIASGSSGNAYVVTDGKTTLLLEAGVSASALCKAVKLEDVDVCLISHEHMDHGKAARDLATRYGIPVAASPGTLEKLRMQSNFCAEPIIDGEELRCKSMIIKAFAVPHDAAEPLGFLVKSADGSKLMFVTDAFYIPIKAPQGLTHLMVECNHSVELLDKMISHGATPHEQRERIRRSHLSLETLCAWLEDNAERLKNVQEIKLLHISSRNGDPEAFRQRVREITGKPVFIC